MTSTINLLSPGHNPLQLWQVLLRQRDQFSEGTTLLVVWTVFYLSSSQNLATVANAGEVNIGGGLFINLNAPQAVVNYGASYTA